MYEYEYFNDNDIDNLFLKKQKNLENLNSFNNTSYKMTVYDESKNKYVKVNIYASGSPGTTIRDAISGHKCDGYIVGSRDEDLFFKVSICTGQFGNKDPVTLFFDSPEEYEKHMFQELSKETKTDWLNKKNFCIKFSSKV